MAGRPDEGVAEQFAEDTFVLTTRELALKYDRSESTIRDWRLAVADMGHKVGYGKPIPEELADEYVKYAKSAPEGVVEDRFPLQIDAEDALVLSDLHAPYIHRKMLARAIYVCRRHFPHVKLFIIAGDLFDFNAISQHPKNGPTTSLLKDLKVGGTALNFLLDDFEHGYVCPGNHDERVAKKVDADVEMEFLVQSALLRSEKGRNRLDRITTTEFDYLDLGHKWRIGHPSGYSQFGGKLPAEIATVIQRNIVSGHTHQWGMMPSRCGKFLGIDNGHLTTDHWYAMRRLSKRPPWQASFTIISRNIAYTFPERFTDWSKWLA